VSGKPSKAERFADSDMPYGEIAHFIDQFRAMLSSQSARVVGLANGAADRPSLLEWSSRFLPRHVRRPPSSMHRWLAAELDSMHGVEGRKLNVLGPRGSAKSTLVTLAYVLRSAVEGREPYIWIVSDTHSQACAHLANLRSELESNRRLRHGYRWSARPGRRWRNDALSLPNGVTIEAFGAGQKIRGRRRREHRPTLIVCDDLQNEQQVASFESRERIREWFHGALLKAGTRQTHVVNLATALHREALACQLDETPGWRSRIFRSIERWPDAMTLWEEWEAIYRDRTRDDAEKDAQAFYTEHRAEMDSGAVLLWPEVEDLYTLMCMRAASGRAAFEREKQNSPLNPALCEWPASYFDSNLWFDDWPRELVVRTIALDPSKGRDDRRGDYSAYALVGVDRQGTIFVEADLARRPTPAMIEDGVELCRRFAPDGLGVESNQFQELLRDDFEEAFRRHGLMTGVWTLDNRVNKQVRIRRLGPYLARGRLRFKSGSPSTALVVDQLRDFPIGDYDDGPDAVEMAVRLAGELLQGNGAADGLGSRLDVA